MLRITRRGATTASAEFHVNTRGWAEAFAPAGLRADAAADEAVAPAGLRAETAAAEAVALAGLCAETAAAGAAAPAEAKAAPPSVLESPASD